MKPSSGHIDNRSTLWIVLILAAVAVPLFVEKKSGMGVVEQFWSLPHPWPGFLLALPAVLVLCFVVLFAGTRRGNATPPSPVDHAGITHLPEREGNRFNLLAGLCSAMLGLTLLVFGVLGPGWVWVLVALVGVLLLGVAALLASMRTTWTFAPGEITRTERVFGQAQTETWSVPEEAVFARSEHTTGGAFGQPLATHYQVRLGEATLLECADRGRADALIAALEAAYPPPPSGRD